MWLQVDTAMYNLTGTYCLVNENNQVVITYPTNKVGFSFSNEADAYSFYDHIVDAIKAGEHCLNIEDVGYEAGTLSEDIIPTTVDVNIAGVGTDDILYVLNSQA